MNNIVLLKEYKKQRIIELANEILNEYVIYDDNEIDIKAILKCMDFKIELKEDFERFNKTDIGMLSIHKYFLKDKGTERVIFLDKKRSEKVKRFTLAYLLGVYALDYHGENCYEKRLDACRYNSFYKLFALNLLMPEELFLVKYAEFKEEYHSYVNLTKALSYHFKVPYDRVQERYFYLNKVYQEKGKIYEYKKI